MSDINLKVRGKVLPTHAIKECGRGIEVKFQSFITSDLLEVSG
jgi:hypothetical protein